MKKFLIATCMLIFSQRIFAQLEKGMIAVGITSSIRANKIENENNFTNGSPSYFYNKNTFKNTSFNVAPTVAYFLSKRWAVGVQVGYIGYVNTNETTKYSAPEEMDYSYTKTNAAGINVIPYVKYYIPLSDNVYFLLKGSYGFSNSAGKTTGYTENTTYDAFGTATTVRTDEYGPDKSKTIGMNLGISPGILFMPSQKIGLEFNLGNVIGMTSSTIKTTENDGNTSKVTTTNLEYFNFNTLSLGTGVYYFFK